MTLPGFFKRVSFATYRDALTEDQARQLSAATLFSLEIPIPLPALGAAGQALGVEAPQAAIARLIGLGLFDDWGEIDGVAHAAANPLARPLASPIDPADRPRLARAAMPELARAWRDREGEFPTDPRGLEAAEVALAAQAEPEVLEAAVLAGAAWLERRNKETRAGARPDRGGHCRFSRRLRLWAKFPAPRARMRGCVGRCGPDQDCSRRARPPAAARRCARRVLRMPPSTCVAPNR